MSDTAYARARKLALREYGARMQKGQSPFLPVLAEIDESLNALARVPLGLIQIPLNKVAGTASKGRTNAFAANFMPLLDPGSEFSCKWDLLYDSVVADGLRQPVTALEYMGRYYLIEGNKRVSVMKYLDAVAIEADVTRAVARTARVACIIICNTGLLFCNQLIQHGKTRHSGRNRIHAWRGLLHLL